MDDTNAAHNGLPNGRIFAYGTCTGCPEQAEMTELLSAHGLRVSMGNYSIKVEDCECFTFEDEGDDGEWCLEGTAATFHVLWRDAHLVSAALTQAGMRHGIEICNAGQTPIEYLHHEWPLGGTGSRA